MENERDEYRYGRHSHGMGMFLPLLAVPLIIGFMKHAARRQHMMMHGMYGEGGEQSEYFSQRRARFEERIQPIFNELHKKAHAAEAKAAEAKAAETV
jgi:hypothetical protein